MIKSFNAGHVAEVVQGAINSASTSKSFFSFYGASNYLMENAQQWEPPEDGAPSRCGKDNREKMFFKVRVRAVKVQKIKYDEIL